MKIVETPIFTKQVLALLDEDDYRKFQIELVIRPASGDIIPGTGGLRKIRWKGSGRGKRGGTRIIYYWFKSKDTLLMLLIYPKNVWDDLSKKQLKVLKALVEKEFDE
jgi:mRNA-degrading endonuclease RelE of RelBE toxin-antitoxin system